MNARSPDNPGESFGTLEHAKESLMAFIETVKERGGLCEEHYLQVDDENELDRRYLVQDKDGTPLGDYYIGAA